MSNPKATKIQTEEDRQAAANYQQALVPRSSSSSALEQVAQADPESPGSLLMLAIRQGVDPDGLAKLVDLYERIDARRAEREFAEALLAFQNECPVINRNKTAEVHKDGKLLYKYDFASLDYLATVIRPHCAKHGLSYTFDGGAVEKNTVTVVTILRHTGGHTQRSTFSAPVDTGARMNPTQQVASAVSYARRYGLLLALGLSTGDDDDGQAAGSSVGEFITKDQVQEIVERIAETGAKTADFCKFLNVDQIAHIQKRDYNKARNALGNKAEENRRKAEAAAERERARNLPAADDPDVPTDKEWRAQWGDAK